MTRTRELVLSVEQKPHSSGVVTMDAQTVRLLYSQTTIRPDFYVPQTEYMHDIHKLKPSCQVNERHQCNQRKCDNTV